MIIDYYKQTGLGLEFIFGGYLYSTYDENFEYNELLLCKETQNRTDAISLFDKLDGIKKLFNSTIQISYYVSDKAISLEEIEERIILLTMGFIDSNKEKHNYYYSELTKGTDYDTTLKVGSHDLFSELYDLYNRYVIFKILLLKD